MSTKIKLPTTPYQLILNILSFLVLAGHLLFLLIIWSRIPDVVPTHFDINGNVDGYGGKGTLLMLPVVNVIMYPLLCLLERFPDLWNVPGKVTPLNQLWIYGNTKSMLITLKFLINAIFCYIDICSALGRSMHILATPMILGSIIGSIVFFLWRAKRM